MIRVFVAARFISNVTGALVPAAGGALGAPPNFVVSIRALARGTVVAVPAGVTRSRLKRRATW